MTQVSESLGQERTSPAVPKQSNLGAQLTIVTTLLKNPAVLRQFRTMSPDEERYVRPPREYELPAYRQGMQYCRSNEKYLRPTRYCNPREPLVIALANELGAYELSDWEFAEASYWWVKMRIEAEMCPFNSVSETLTRGTGTCWLMDAAWIALCRAAGIKARYKIFTTRAPEDMMKLEMNEGAKKAFDAINSGTPEAEAEVCIDGKWIVGHAPGTPETYAGLGVPVSKFGEESIGLEFELIPGTIRRWESIPLRLATQMKVICWLAPAMLERVNVVYHGKNGMTATGRQILEEAGGWEAYDRMARERLRPPSPTIEDKEDTALVFEA